MCLKAIRIYFKNLRFKYKRASQADSHEKTEIKLLKCYANIILELLEGIITCVFKLYPNADDDSRGCRYC